MLKFEKKAHDITICVREKQNFWSPTLLKALGIALALHLGALLIFHIPTFKLTSTFTFSPIEMQMQGNAKEGHVLTILNPIHESEEFPLLAFHTPKTPKVPQALLQKDKQEALLFFPPLEPTISSFPISPVTYKPVQLVVRGNLMQRKVMPFAENVWIKEGALHTYEIGYRAQIDPDSGLIVWYDKIQSSGEVALDRWTEQLLLDLQFATTHPFEAINGEVYFQVTLDNKKDLRELFLIKEST